MFNHKLFTKCEPMHKFLTVW